ncbi:MAG: hypothetical protein DMF61_25605 [Blastocatellia bacterium AA13]|nr:MAG: hypothetical protein DMF61_25605 [Blastocatellia bacterium AA13]
MSIVLENLIKRFANQLVVDRLSLEVADGELFVLLGASGSGKSTVLRLIAGLEPPDEGRIMLYGVDVTNLAPQERGAGFVFQNYALFRHMTVAENIEFGLKVHRVKSKERAKRRDELLDLVGLAGLGRRYAHQLSGGQQQRVALARALAHKPKVLLLDEPFGALDVKIRAQLRRSLRAVQQQLGLTTILVTHDQEEAFELADRIGVVERGRLLEIGPPESLYTGPRSLFVSTFLGAGNVLVGRARNERAVFGSLSVPIPGEVPHDEGASVQMLFRPEHVDLSETEPPNGAMILGKGEIVEQSFSGTLRRIRLRLGRLPATRQIAPAVPFGEEHLLVDAVVPSAVQLGRSELWVSLREWHILEQPPFRLLVCDPGSTSAGKLLDTARALSRGLDAAITLLGVAKTEKAAEKLRAALATRLKEAGLAESLIRLRHGDPAKQILTEQSESLYDLLLVAAKTKPSRFRLGKGRRAPARHLGSTVPALLERAQLPVMVIKGEWSKFAKILICTAAGEPGERDVRIGGRLARLLGASVTLLYITREEGEPPFLAHVHLERGLATLRGLDVSAEVRIRHAVQPSQGILSEASEGDYDIIVLGSHGRRPRLLFGANDITMQVISASDRPILVIPPFAG